MLMDQLTREPGKVLIRSRSRRLRSLLVDEIWQEAYAVMEEKAAKHIYTHSFSDFYYKKMKESEKSLRKDDLLFCGAPHL